MKEASKMRKQACAFALVFMLPGYAVAQSETPPPMSLEQQEQLEAKERLSNTIGRLGAALIEFTAAKKTQCMKAFGNTEFCDCIANKSPTGVDFFEYVAIVAGTKEDFKYDQRSADDKKLFDATRTARDECVSWKGEGDQIKPAN
jgi:hypothetical protein